MRIVFLYISILYFILQFGYANSLAKFSSIDVTSNKIVCVAYTKKDNLCLTPQELEVYYKKYKEKILNKVEKGNWYFTLADLIQVTKLLMFEKMLYNEAKKSDIEKSKYFEKYKPEIEKGYKSVEKRVKTLLQKGEISPDRAKIFRAKFEGSYL